MYLALAGSAWPDGLYFLSAGHAPLRRPARLDGIPEVAKGAQGKAQEVPAPVRTLSLRGYRVLTEVAARGAPTAAPWRRAGVPRGR